MKNKTLLQNTTQISYHDINQRAVFKPYLKGVDVKCSNRPCVFVALSDDHVAVTRDDLGWVINDDVSSLSSSN